MPGSTSSNINTAKRTRRSNKQNRHRRELSHVIRYPSLNNIAYYAKYFFFKTAFGRIVLLFTMFAGFNIYFFSQVYWPKISVWLQNSTSTSTSIDTTSFESHTENEF
ncbi:unnamed protein product [Rotaria sordida]|uniref:Uncharacterized protein n=1 Tax=Rotaria sordida TaxID=392033 RepID=A0A814BHY7_9BILA|nr:unnamed protein product [Rotaria sordida]CAF0925871.1 unnamed protein product [Rotaria sordida]CAF0928622.1 unnamed protein product [Rotaria sordida]